MRTAMSSRDENISITCVAVLLTLLLTILVVVFETLSTAAVIFADRAWSVNAPLLPPPILYRERTTSNPTFTTALSSTLSSRSMVSY